MAIDWTRLAGNYSASRDEESTSRMSTAKTKGSIDWGGLASNYLKSSAVREEDDLKKRIDSALDQNKSLEDIAKDTGLNLQSVTDYALSTRPNYGQPAPTDKRGLLSKAFDQVNPLDSGRSWGRETPTEEGAQLGLGDQAGQVASTLFSGVEKVDDSVKALTGDTERNQLMREKIFNDLINQVNAKLEADPNNEELKKTKGNIIKKRAELLQSDLADTAFAGTEDKGTLDRLKTAAGVSLEATSEIVPFMKGAQALQAGAKTGAAFGAATGLAHGTGGELTSEDGFDIKNVALETVLGGAAGGVGGAVSSRLATRSAGRKFVQSQPEVVKEAGRLKRAVTTVKGQFDGMGQAGKQFGAKLDAVEDIAETSVGRWVQEAPTVFKGKLGGGLSKKDFTSFVDTLETLRNGGEVKMTPNIKKAVDEWVALAPKIREEALATGVDVGDLGPYYFPKNYAYLDTKKGLQRAAEHLVSTGQADNVADAARTLEIMRRSAKSKPYGHLEMERVLDLPEYEKTRAALGDYLAGSGNRIGNAVHFGPKNEIAEQLIDEMVKEGYSLDRATKLMRVAQGTEIYNENWKKISTNFRQFNTFRSLRNAAISNLGQTTNTATVSGYLNTVKGGLKMFSPAMRKRILDSGVTSDAVINKLVQEYGIDSTRGLRGIAGRVSAPIFGEVEKFNRSLAAAAGDTWATKMAKRAAKGNTKALRDLRRLGVTGEIGQELTDAQRIQASRGLVERTQFKVGAKDMPAWSNSPEGKMAMQFRSFTYKQTGFMYNEIIKPLSEGNVKPLLRFAAAAPIGGGVAWLKNQSKTKLEGGKDNLADMTMTERIINAYESLGAIGFGGDVQYAAEQYGKQGTGFEEAVAGSVGGPTAGYLLGTAFDIGEARGGDATSLARRGIEAATGPAGKAITNRTLPYKNNSLAANIGNEETAAQLESLGKEIDYTPSLPSRTQRDRELNDQEYDQYLSTYRLYYNQYFSQVANTTAFKEASPSVKKQVLQAVNRRAGDDTRNSLFGKLTDKPKLGSNQADELLKSAGLR